MKDSLMSGWELGGYVVAFLIRRLLWPSPTSPNLAGLASCQKADFTLKNEGNMTMPSETTASDVITGLEKLIEGALGSSESSATKTRLHAVASVMGALGDDLVPLLESKFDIATLFGAIQRVENGVTETEEGVRDLVHSLKVKKDTSAPTGNPVGIAA